MNGTEGYDYNSVMRKFKNIEQMTSTQMGDLEMLNIKLDVRKSQKSAIFNNMVSTVQYPIQSHTSLSMANSFFMIMTECVKGSLCLTK